MRRPDTVAGWLARAEALAHPRGGVRFLDRREQATWHDWPALAARARRAAGTLRAAGVRSRDRVALILPTGPGFFDAFLGCAVLGAVPVPLYPPVRLGRLDEYVARTAAMLAAVDAVALVTDARVRRVLGQVVARARPPRGVLDAAALPEGPEAGGESGPDALALVQFSSGTTVAPKPVGLTHRQVLANAGRICDVITRVTPPGADPEPAGVSWLPLYHDMGLIGCVFPALMVPGPLTLIPPEAFLARPALWLRAISAWRGTVSPAPDFAYGLCAERIRDEEVAGLDLSCWRMALDGAEPVSAATLRAFADRFARCGFDPRALMPVYGLSEAALAVTFPPPGRGVRSERFDRAALAAGRAVPAAAGVELVSVGRPLPDFRVRVVDAEGGERPAGAVGHIQARGPSIMAGYLDREDQPFADGWLETGDLGFVHDGELFVAGRAKDVIITRGQNHAPQDLERAVDRVPGVRTGCAVAVGDAVEGRERVLLFVEARAPHEGLADACGRAALAATGVAPDLVLLLDPGTLPRTSSGKLRRGETLRRFRAGTLTPPRPITPLMVAGVLAESLVGHLRARWGARGPR